jgi:hypothetical protein
MKKPECDTKFIIHVAAVSCTATAVPETAHFPDSAIRQRFSEIQGTSLAYAYEEVPQRVSHERPLLFTSQYGGSALESQFQRPEMGAAGAAPDK